MPNLSQRLTGLDLGFLEIIAELWGGSLEAQDVRQALQEIQEIMLDPAIFEEMMTALPLPARAALDELVRHEGKLPWVQFVRNFGALREMGPGKRDREKPHLDPASACETLWYHGLIGREFLKLDDELQECAYIPDEFLEWMPPVAPLQPLPPGRAASPLECAHLHPADDRILDHACTLLAARRMNLADDALVAETWQPPLYFVEALLRSLGLITAGGEPDALSAQPFLECSRADALNMLVAGWLDSFHFNELRLMPAITCEGEWVNDALKTRQAVFDLISAVPEGIWWNLETWIDDIRQLKPDFQRPNGDFTSWIFRSAETNASCSGESHWQDVDGALLRFFITGVMHWLGLVDLAGASAEGEPQAFRFSAWAEALLLHKSPSGFADENGRVEINRRAALTLPRFTPRIARYQLARFCLWKPNEAESYSYTLSPASLKRASEQGLKVAHLVILLRKYAKTPPSPALLRALTRWETGNREAFFERTVVLRLKSAEMLTALRQQPISRFLGDVLGPTAVVIPEDAIGKVTEALLELGFLADVQINPPNKGKDNE